VSSEYVTATGGGAVGAGVFSVAMGETELSVICKNCGSEVSPYVTECPYCGARLRKRAPKLQRRGDALEAKAPRRPRRLLPRRRAVALDARPWATAAFVAASAALLLVQEASGSALDAFGGIVVPLQDEWWRYLTAPFNFGGVGYLFVVAVALAIFGTGVERRLGTPATAILLLACGALGMVVAVAVADARGAVEAIGGGNGVALGALAAWLTLRRGEAAGPLEGDYDRAGVIVAAAVLLALPLVVPAADFFAGLGGGAVGALAGLAASALRPAH